MKQILFPYIEILEVLFSNKKSSPSPLPYQEIFGEKNQTTPQLVYISEPQNKFNLPMT